MSNQYYEAVAKTIADKTGKTIIGVGIDPASTGYEIFGNFVEQGGKRSSYRLRMITGNVWNLETAEVLGSGN